MGKIFRLVLLFGIYLTVDSYGVGSVVQAAGSGWVLTQRSHILGDNYVYLSKSGIKCVNPRQGLNFVTCAPSWNVIIYNERTKLYYVSSFQRWKQNIKAKGITPEGVSWRKGGLSSIAGLRAREYLMSNKHRQSSSNKMTGGWTAATYWVAEDIPVPTELADLLANAYGLPTAKAIPLQLTYKDVQGKEENILWTYQYSSAKIPESYFGLPPHYQLAKSEMQVMMSAKNQQMVEDLTHDLGSNKYDSRSNLGTALKNSGISISNGNVTLPNGKTLSKVEINKYLDAFKSTKH